MTLGCGIVVNRIKDTDLIPTSHLIDSLCFFNDCFELHTLVSIIPYVVMPHIQLKLVIGRGSLCICLFLFLV